MSDLYWKVRGILQGRRKDVASKNYDSVAYDIMEAMCEHYHHQYEDKNSTSCENCGQDRVVKLPRSRSTSPQGALDEGTKSIENVDVDCLLAGENNDCKDPNKE